MFYCTVLHKHVVICSDQLYSPLQPFEQHTIANNTNCSLRDLQEISVGKPERETVQMRREH